MPHEQISRAIREAWTLGTRATAFTLFPGSVMPVSGMTRWYEMWLPEWSTSGASRQPEVTDLLIAVHLFAQRLKDQPAVTGEMLDQATRTFDNKVLCLPPSAAGVSYTLRLGIAERRDLSSQELGPNGRGLTHWVLHWPVRIWSDRLPQTERELAI